MTIFRKRKYGSVKEKKKRETQSHGTAGNQTIKMLIMN